MKREFIPAVENEIADSLPRLCPVSDRTEINTEIYLNVITETEEINAPVEPRTLNDEIFHKLSKVHNPFVGHLGVERTIKKY